jgi:exopolyphosphatase/pppGpp-phosphohydrolase
MPFLIEFIRSLLLPQILSGKEEACLIYLGILQALPVFEKTVLTVDIGGGSTEFVVGKAGEPLYATSLKLGHVRLTEQCIGSGNEPLQKSQVGFKSSSLCY